MACRNQDVFADFDRTKSSNIINASDNTRVSSVHSYGSLCITCGSNRSGSGSFGSRSASKWWKIIGEFPFPFNPAIEKNGIFLSSFRRLEEY